MLENLWKYCKKNWVIKFKEYLLTSSLIKTDIEFYGK